MAWFTDDDVTSFLSKEWLSKTDNETSTAYLMKLHVSPDLVRCAMIVTDTKQVWGEVLNGNQIARRWKSCNPAIQSTDYEGDDDWRQSILRVLSDAHSIGGFSDFSFEVVETRYSDFAFTVENETLKWTWEACFLGHRLSSEILSKQLILPLISFNHLAFTSSEPMARQSEDELQKNIDKVGRTARRAMDNHIKNALSKSAVSTGLSRLTSLLHNIPSPPSVTLEPSSPDLILPKARGSSNMEGSILQREKSAERRQSDLIMKDEAMSVDSVAGPSNPLPSKNPSQTNPEDTETESEDDADLPALPSRNTQDSKLLSSDLPREAIHDRPSSSSDGPETSKLPAKALESNQEPEASDDPAIPGKKLVKRLKVAESSDEDSDSGKKTSKSHVAAGTGLKRGTRQPLKRGGKRF